MHLLYNALPATNISTGKVVRGHITALANAARVRLSVLHHEHNKDLARDLGGYADWICCPDGTRNWGTRIVWEATSLPGIVREIQADALMSISGILNPTVTVPQIVFAHNPWALSTRSNQFSIRPKVMLQRAGYRRAMAGEHLMVFNSNYMRRLYRRNAMTRENRSCIAYNALDDRMHDAAESVTGYRRRPFSILFVSEIAPHKDIESLIDLLEVLRKDRRIPVTARIVGPWADRAYLRAMRREVARRKLDAVVDFSGYVQSVGLVDAYASFRLFVTTSRSESFGLPAIEAQRFGMPVVACDDTAVPEVCAGGGLYFSRGDLDRAADLVQRMLSDDDYWAAHSAEAVRNAKRYRWSATMRPLIAELQQLTS